MKEYKNSKILIVEDEEINRNIITEQLKKYELILKEVENGKQALKILELDKFDLILLDIQMPEMDGYEVLEKLKKDEKLKHIPVIMITSVDDIKSVARCISMGAEDYLIKPFEPVVLTARIKNSLDKYSALKNEKELLEKTLTGSIKILIELLSVFRPNIFGQTARIRSICRGIAKKLNIKELWHIEVASLLSQLGSIVLSPDIVEKIEINANLLPNEKKEFEKSPQFGYNFVKQLPRLEKVAQIILHQNADFHKITSIPPDRERPNVPMEAFILKLAIDFNRQLNMGLNFTEIMEDLIKKKEKYHPKALSTLNEMIQKEVKRDIRSYNISAIEPGMIFMENVMTESGSQIIAKGQEASATLLVRLKNIKKRMTVIEPIKVLLPYKMNIFE